VRLAKQTLRQRINKNLRVEFTDEKITTFSGLEYFRRYFARTGLAIRIRKAFSGRGYDGDFGVSGYIFTFFALWLTGGRRLRHVDYIAQDPLVKRFCGLFKLPSDRSLSRWLSSFTNKDLEPLDDVNLMAIKEKLQALQLTRVTLDLDGTVLSCGDQVRWAHRGYNPQNRHAKSYFPILCHIAQTGHFLRVVNRPGNIHDANGALIVLREAVEQIKEWLPKAVIEVRMDSAFFQREIIKYLEQSKVEYAIKVPMWSWLNLKWIMACRERWLKADAKIEWFKLELPIEQWDLTVPLRFFRIKIADKLPKCGHQLDFFTPDDGIYEHQVILTNRDLGPGNLLDFYNGRCAMEKNIAELKGEFGFDAVPTKDYQGNSAYQNLSVMAYNLVRNFQIDMGIAPARKATVSRTAIMAFESLKTLRFELILAAGRIVNCSGEKILRVVRSASREMQYQDLDQRLRQIEAP
jgi:hypothetical protein